MESEPTITDEELAEMRRDACLFDVQAISRLIAALRAERARVRELESAISECWGSCRLRLRA